MNQIQSSEIDKSTILTRQKVSQTQFSSVLPPELATATTLVFTSSLASTQVALSKKVLGFIVLEKIYDEVKDLFTSQHSVWTTKQINAAMSEILPLFDFKPKGSGSIHPTAVIHTTARLGQHVTVDEYVVIKDNVIIGDHSWIGTHTVIEASAVIGSHSHIASHNVISSFCEIGSSCVLASHNTIGSDGFGYYTDRSNTHHKIAQIGKVVIEDHCEIGSHCSVDRATLTETRIKAGSKLDNFCHIAHNVTIGENAMLTGGFMVAGSTVIGKNLLTGGGTHVNGHIQIADNVILAARTGVVNSIDASGAYGGYPEAPFKENLRIMSSFALLPKMRKQILRILKQLNIEDI